MQPDLTDIGQRERETKAAAGGIVFWQLSGSQKRRINRDFSAKLQLLAWDGANPAPYVCVLGRLHDYRNEMYHRDESRPAALRTMVHLYAWLVTDLLDRLTAGWFSWSSADPDNLLQRTYLRMGMEPPGKDREILGPSFDIQNDMARVLRRDLDLADVPTLLADYAASRLDKVHGSLRFCAEFLADEYDVEKVTEVNVVRFMHATRPVVQLADLAAVRTPVTRRMIATWDAWPHTIRTAGEPLDAFRCLAQLEAEFEPFEARVEDLAAAIDRELQFRSDWARGNSGVVCGRDYGGPEGALPRCPNSTTCLARTPIARLQRTWTTSF